jgi:hypothetical protein
MCLSDLGAKFPDKSIGSFLQAVAASMNWCDVRSVDSLWLSLRMQWQGVGTLIAQRAPALSFDCGTK